MDYATPLMTAEGSGKADLGAIAFPEEVIELPVLLPQWQVRALESAAHREGLTTGQMIRKALARLIEQAEPSH